MLILFIMLIVGFGIAALINWSTYTDCKYANAENKRYAFICAAICLSFILLTTYLFKTEVWVQKDHRSAIVSLERAPEINGSFFLGSGSIEGKPHYYYYVKFVDGTLGLRSVAHDKVYLKETDDEAPAYVTYTNEPTKHSWFWPNDCGCKSATLVVPTGTIVRNFRG